MNNRHALLARQLRKSGIEQTALSPAWQEFIAAVDRAYHDCDNDRQMVERSLDLSSKELRHANAEMRAIFHAMPDMFFVIDRAGIVIDCHGGNATDLELRADNTIGRCLFDLPASGPGKLLRAAVARVFEEQRLATLTYPVREQGAKRFYEVRILPLAADQAMAIIRNVTQSKEALLALREQRVLFETVLRQAADGIVVCNAEGRVMFVNSAALKLGESDPLGSHIADAIRKWGVPHDARGALIPGDDWAPVRALRGDTCATREERLVRSDGSHIDVLTGASPIRDLAGRITGVVTSLTNITALKTAQDELRTSEEQFRQIADNFPQVIWLTDLDRTRANYVSPAYERVWGRSLASVAQDPASWLEAVHPDDLERLTGALQRPGGEEFEIEYRISRPDGTLRWIRSRGFPIRDPQGRVVRVSGVAEDITEARMLHAQLVQAQKLESIGQLAAGIAHEINTPTQYVGDNTCFLKDAFTALSTLIGSYRELLAAVRAGSADEHLIAAVEHAERLADLPYLSAEIPRAIAQSLEGIERVTKIVRSMKEFSHPGTAEKHPVDINHAIENTLSVSRNEWKYVAEVVTDLDRDLPPVPALAGELNQVLLNIVVNAAHAIEESRRGQTEGNGQIRVQTRRMDDHAEIRIADTGTGIPESIRHKIFDPFFTTKPVGKGTGQGLAIARSVVVDKHGGTLCCESQPGRGSTFIIRLPLSARVQPAGVGR